MRRNFIILFLIAFSLKAQQYNFIRYDVKDGVALSQISKLENFSDGRLIISTYGGGINIYDGQKFHLLNNSHGLINNNIYGLVKQNDTLIYFGTEKGLSVFDGSKFKNYSRNEGLPSNLIWSMTLGKDNVLWIGTDNGLAKYENGKIEKVDNELVSNIDIWSLFSDSKGDLWIGSIDELISFDFKTKEFVKRKEFLKFKTIHSFSEDKNGVIWAGSDYGLYKIQNSNYKLFGLESGLTSDLIWTTYIDSENNLWLGTNKGLALFDEGKVKNFGLKEGLTDYKIWTIKEDLEKNLWIGSDEGLYKLTDIAFKIYKEFDDTPIDAWTIVEKSDNEYWIGSELQGVISFKNGQFSEVKIGDFNLKGMSTFFIDRDNNVWITSENGIYRYSNNNFKESTAKYINVDGSVPTVIQDENGKIIFGTYYDGRIEFDGKKFTQYSNTSVDDPIIYYYFIDSQKRLWAATSAGLETSTNDSTFVPKDFEWTKEYSFLNLLEDSYGYIWAGSYEGGLFCFNSESLLNPKFDTISVNHGLNNQSIMATAIDNDGNLWISTNGGFNRLNLEEYHRAGKKNILSYDLNDGIPGVEGFQNGILKDSKNNILISTIDGLVIFDPKKIKENKKPPVLKITNLKIIDHQFKERNINNTECLLGKNSYLELPYYENNLTIEFVGISLTNPSKVKYSYKLGKGDWTKPSSVAKAYLPNLPYGEYNFQVKASNNNGIWSAIPSTLSFKVIAPLWRKLWFQLLMIFAALGIIMVFYLYRLNRMNEVNKDLEDRIEERIKYEAKLKKSERDLRIAKETAEKSEKLKSEFLAQMSHEIRTPINSILSYTGLIKENVIDKVDDSLKDGFSIIESGSKRLIRTIDSILNMSQLQTGNFELNKKNLNIYDTLKDLHTEFKNAAIQKNILFEFISDSKECFVFADHYTVTQLFANLIDNAIKYTISGKIEIKIQQPAKDKVIVEISDTGIGISEEFKNRIFNPFAQEEQGYSRKYEGTGLGLSLVKKYCNLNDATLSYQSEKNKGTKFIVEFAI